MTTLPMDTVTTVGPDGREIRVMIVSPQGLAALTAAADAGDDAGHCDQSPV